MKEIVKLGGKTLFVSIIFTSVFALGLYWVSAWSGVGNLEATSGEVLTMTEWNKLVQRTAYFVSPDIPIDLTTDQNIITLNGSKYNTYTINHNMNTINIIPEINYLPDGATYRKNIIDYYQNRNGTDLKCTGYKYEIIDANNIKVMFRTSGCNTHYITHRHTGEGSGLKGQMKVMIKGLK